MVDRVAQSSSRIPVSSSPSVKSPSAVVQNGKCSTSEVDGLVSISSGSSESSSVSEENGVHVRDGEVFLDQAEPPRLPKAIVPKQLGLDTVTHDGSLSDKGFETFLMTGDMIIHKNPSLKVKDMNQLVGRHHSDSSPYKGECEKVAFKRSASSPDQSSFTGAKTLTHENVTMDNLSKALLNDEDNAMNRKESAESGFEEQAVHSDSGTLEKKEKLPNDPLSVSDLSEVDSDDLLGNMVGSQTSAKCSNLSEVSTPSDLKSDISANTVLQQETEPLINDESSSSSSIDLSSTESYSEELTHEMIFERSLSDSGGMSPVYHKDVKNLIASKSSEKILIRKQMKQNGTDHQSVRASKSQENYVGEDVTFVNIDFDDTAYSLDQIPTCETPTKEEYKPFMLDLSHPKNYDNAVKTEKQRPKELVTSEKPRPPDPNDNRVFMPAFVKLSDSVKVGHDVDGDISVGDSEDIDTAQDSQEGGIDDIEDGLDSGAIDSPDDTGDDEGDDNVMYNSDISDGYDMEYSGDEEYCYNENSDILQEDLFAIPPSKSVDHPSAKRLAKRLYNLDGFRKSDVARHLCKK